MARRVAKGRLAEIAALSQADDPGAVEALAEAATDSDEEIRRAGLVALAKHGATQAVADLGLKDSRATMRAVAAELLADAPDAVNVVVERYLDPGLPVAEDADDLVVRVMDTSSPGGRAAALTVAEGALSDPDRRVRAARLLGAAREAGATPALLDVLQTGDAGARAAAATALGRIQDPRVAQPLLTATSDEAPEVSAAAREALAGMGRAATFAFAALPHASTSDPQGFAESVGALLENVPASPRPVATPPPRIEPARTPAPAARAVTPPPAVAAPTPAAEPEPPAPAPVATPAPAPAETPPKATPEPPPAETPWRVAEPAPQARAGTDAAPPKEDRPESDEAAERSGPWAAGAAAAAAAASASVPPPGVAETAGEGGWSLPAEPEAAVAPAAPAGPSRSQPPRRRPVAVLLAAAAGLAALLVVLVLALGGGDEPAGERTAAQPAPTATAVETPEGRSPAEILAARRAAAKRRRATEATRRRLLAQSRADARRRQAALRRRRAAAARRAAARRAAAPAPTAAPVATSSPAPAATAAPVQTQAPAPAPTAAPPRPQPTVRPQPTPQVTQPDPVP